MKKVAVNFKVLFFLTVCSVVTFLNINSTSAQTIAVSPIPLSFCSCEPLVVNYNATGIFNIGNVFSVELSDASGNFGAPTIIGTLVGNALNGNIPCVIPCNAPYGTGYRIRISSTSPFFIGTDNGADITINPSPIVNITLTNGNCIDTLTANVTGGNIGVQPGQKYYITDSPPWGSPSNVNEMNDVFGVGNWIQANFSVNAATVFTPATQFVFLEGSDGNAIALDNFMIANATLIESWVNAGGRLFLNAAPNQGGIQFWGFGGTQLNYQNLIPAIANAVPGVNITNMAHPINIGPYTPLDPTGVYTANYYAHADVVNGGTTLIHSSANSNFAVLSEKTWGAGLVLFGGMTTSNWHNNVFPLVNQHAVNLRKNILYYTAGAFIAPAYTYTYLWSTGDTTQKILPTITGVYTVTVTSSNGCTGTATYNYTAPNPIVVAINNTTSPSCIPGCDGTATTNVAGGIAPYNYTISGGALISGSGFASNLCAGIIYTITVTDANGCTGSTTVQLTSPNAPVITIASSTNPSCVPGCDGTAITNTVGGVPVYNYAISGGANINASGVVSNLCAGFNYIITVTDANGCIGTTSIQPTVPNLPGVTITNQTNVSCFGSCDGIVSVLGNGGAGLYNYTINPVATQGPVGTFTGLCAGLYQITVTDVLGCTTSTNINITQAPQLSVSITAFTNVTVFGGANGSITAAAMGGTPGYVYTISPAIGAQAPSGNFINLTAAGGQQCYTITVTDANGCTATTTQCITQPVIGNLTTVSTDETCFGACNGTITSTITGGVAPFNFLLNPGNINNGTGVYNNLCSGIYTIIVTDANNNTVSSIDTINGPAQIIYTAATPTNINCFGAANGLINVTTTAGVGVVTYTINPLGPQTNTNGVFTSLTAQCYTVTATDANGCTSSTSLCITEPLPFTVGNAIIQDNNCFGDAAGTITVTAIGGNPLPNYTYNIMPGGQTNQTGIFTGLQAGNYTITVIDGLGCTASTAGIVVNQPAQMVFNTVNLHEVYCYGQATGSIAVVAGGGTGNITFSITPNATQFPLGFFKDLYAGNYTITATDINGCSISTTSTILQNPALRITSLQIVEPLCAYDTTGVLTVVAIGGTAPLLYSLNNGIPQTTGLFTGLPADMYKVTLIDNLGCSKDTIVQLSGPSPVGANITIEDTKCIDSKDGRLTVTGTGGQGGYKYYVTPGFNINKTGKFYGLAADTYTLRVVDTIGCEYMTVFTINPPANPLGNSMSKIDLACHGKGNEGSATANAFGGQAPYVYEWSTSPVQNTPVASVLYYGWYHLLIVDANGCEYKDSVYVEEGPCCDVTFIPNAFSPNGDNNNDEFKVFTTAGIELLQLEIYDRWGQRLWSTSDYKRGWDGKVEGKEAPVSTYFYVFKYLCTRDGKSYIKKGDVTLIR